MTIATEVAKMTAHTEARRVLLECVAHEQLMEDRLNANPTCPLAANDYRVASMAVDAASEALERLS